MSSASLTEASDADADRLAAGVPLHHRRVATRPAQIRDAPEAVSRRRARRLALFLMIVSSLVTIGLIAGIWMSFG